MTGTEREGGVYLYRIWTLVCHDNCNRCIEDLCTFKALVSNNVCLYENFQKSDGGVCVCELRRLGCPLVAAIVKKAAGFVRDIALPW
mmetsp:Transcript_18603/g.36461  ORF Transcript_18603/g.36461 Transcript_18603/m.36461 type:complete len:87 (+) Transcript_18603:362-622(+)